MNKYGFLSSITTFILLFFQFIPLGIYFEAGGEISLWLVQIFGIHDNPFLNYYDSFPLDLFHYQDKQVYLSGILTGGDLIFWYQIHIITFIILFGLSLVTGILALIGSFKENKVGGKLISFNFYALLTIFLYLVIGVPAFSRDLIGFQFQILDLFYYLSFGFYLLLINLIVAIYANINHPMKE